MQSWENGNVQVDGCSFRITSIAQATRMEAIGRLFSREMRVKKEVIEEFYERGN